ncbi:MAG: L-seryl-tRNA(Sec) selenium transferase [Planctomycetia bacterium]|nr:L-seryl-tRNA(Sec) selenium transferase [Planctomycetia bacterium]
MAPNPLRNIPSVTQILESPAVRGLAEKISHNVVVDRVRTFLDEMRVQFRDAAADANLPTLAELADRIARYIQHSEQPRLRPVINATGILLHTGLGRAPLAKAAIDDLVAVAGDYASVEIDLASGKRSQRVDAVEGLVRQLTGAEAAAVCNNNAGATLLVLAALAAGREVIVSRGQLIEIGGSFRLPEVMAAGGATLREVGTTNKTRISDYGQAIGPQTAALMQVHTSNFRVVGFTESAALEELVRLGRKHSLPVIDDIGSGALVDFAQFGCRDEPVAAESIRTGADLVLFSGDKLLGGPQCGIIAGRKDLVKKCASHPLMRALRVDKLTLAALAATLRLYRDPEVAQREVPLLTMLTTPPENLMGRAQRLAEQLRGVAVVKSAEAVADVTYLGGGSVPTQQLPTWCVLIEPVGMSVDDLSRELRSGTPAVMGRVQQDRFLLDLRSVPPRHDRDLLTAVEAIGKRTGSGASDGEQTREPPG